MDRRRVSAPVSAPVAMLRKRRLLAAALAAAPAWWLAGRAEATALRATPAQTEGPFYPLADPADVDADLLRNGALAYRQGQAAWLVGSVSDLGGRPLAGATVEIWQCDHAGRYHHPREREAADPRFQGFGRATVAADGGYRFRTLRPAAYSGRTPHIHVKVKHGGRELLTTQLYVAGDPGNARDFLWTRLSRDDRAALTVDFVAAADGLLARFPIVVAV